MLQVRVSSFVIFHLLKDAGYVEVLDSEALTRFETENYTNPYEALRAVLNHIDNMDENVTVRATTDSVQAFLIGRSDLEPDEEVIDCVETEWQANLDKEYDELDNAQCLIKFMGYMMMDEYKEALYDCWNTGEFSSIYHEWQDCPLEAFLFSDSELFCHVTSD